MYLLKLNISDIDSDFFFFCHISFRLTAGVIIGFQSFWFFFIQLTDIIFEYNTTQIALELGKKINYL